MARIEPSSGAMAWLDQLIGTASDRDVAGRVRAAIDQLIAQDAVLFEVDAADTDGSRVFPDIIVHHRNSSENFLVIEIKKSNSTVSDNEDREKLQAFCDELSYKHALFLRFVSPTAKPDIATVEWIGARAAARAQRS